MIVALTIGGSDSGAAAGIQADLKTFAAHGLFGVCAVTAITAQNSVGVRAFTAVPADLVAAQIDAVADDFDIAAVKIGMLATGEIAETVGLALHRHQFAVVVLDPIVRSTSGTSLLDDAGLAVVRSTLLPLASVVTPNAAEAEILTGDPVKTRRDARRAAERLAALGARAVVVKGGHLDDAPVDVVCEAGVITELEGERLDTSRVHGTGCTFAAALTARLASGMRLVDAARAAKAYVADAIRRAPGLGHGRGPLRHL